MNIVPQHSIDSDALKANLLETAEYVEIRSDLTGLLEAVERYRGIHTRLENLLLEICHPYRNWNIILPLLRSFVLKNFQHYLKTDYGPQACAQFLDLFFEAVDDSLRNEMLLAQVFEAQWDWIDKLITQLSGDNLQAFEKPLNYCFSRFIALATSDEHTLLSLIHGRQSVKRVLARLHQLVERTGVDYDMGTAVELLRLVLKINYTYWLQEEDPSVWFST
ncbi:MAG: phosphoenolpyruvate synthase, partial [Desulfofustis sp.]